MSIEAMKQALEAMEFANDTCIRNIGIGIIDISVITSLRAIIEQMEKAEPVGHFKRAYGGQWTQLDPDCWPNGSEDSLALYTHPAPTPDEITKLRAKLAEVERVRDGLIRALDDEMVTTHLGVFNSGDDPREALIKLMCWSQDVGAYFAKDQLAATQAEVETLRKDAETAWAQAHRLALELECFLLSCKDMPTVSKWWDSAHEALEEHRKLSAMQPAADEAGKGE